MIGSWNLKKIILVLILPVVVLSTIIISVLPYWTIAYVKQTVWKNGVLYGVDQWKDDIRIFGCDANGKNAWIDTIYLDNEYDMSFYNVETVNLIDDNTFGLLLKNVNITDVNRFVYITYDLEKRHVINTEDVNIEQNNNIYMEKEFENYIWYVSNDGSVWQKDNKGNDVAIFVNDGKNIPDKNIAYTFENDGLYFYNTENNKFYIIDYSSKTLNIADNISFNNDISSLGSLYSINEMNDGVWTASFYDEEGKLLPMVVGKSTNLIEKLVIPIGQMIFIIAILSIAIIISILCILFLIKKFRKTFPTELKIICLSIPMLIVTCVIVEICLENILKDDVENRILSQMYYTANTVNNSINLEAINDYEQAINVYESTKYSVKYNVVYNSNGEVTGIFDGLIGNVSVFGYKEGEFFNADTGNLFCAPITFYNLDLERKYFADILIMKSPIKCVLDTYSMGKCLALYYPIIEDNDVIGVTRVLYPEKYIENDIEEQQNQLIYDIAIFLTCIITFLALISFLLLRPLKKIGYDLSDFSTGIDLKRPKEGGLNEIKEMSILFYNMAVNTKEHLIDINQIKEAYEPYIPQKLINIFGKDDIRNISTEDETTIEDVSILIIDTIGFSKAIEKANVQEMFCFVNNVLEKLTGSVEEEGGVVIQFTYTGLYAYFKNSTINAFNAAISAQKSLETISSNLAGENIVFGAGLIFGSIDVGVIGGDERMEIRAVSPEMSFARYLQKLCGIYNFGVLIDETIEEKIPKIKEQSDVRYIGLIGFSSKSICNRKIYEAFVGQNQETVMLKKITKKDFELGVKFFQEYNYVEAKKCFIHVLKKNKDDLAAGRYLRLCSDKIAGNEKGMNTFEQY